MKGIVSDQTDLFGNSMPVVIPQKVKAIVEQVLIDHPAARNNDMVLLHEVWKAQGFIMPGNFSREAFTAETVCRWRRKLQENGLFPASSKAKQNRTEKEEEFRKQLKR